MALPNVDAFNIIPKHTETFAQADVHVFSDKASNVVTRNELSYNASPTRSNDMTLHNDEEAFYVPTIEVTLAYLSVEECADLMQIANSKGFIVQYIDQELMTQVFRHMYMTEQSIENLVMAMNGAADGVTQVKVKMVSRYGYPYTPTSDPDFGRSTRYHYRQLYIHRSWNDMLPDGAEEADYV